METAVWHIRFMRPDLDDPEIPDDPEVTDYDDEPLPDDD